MAPTGTDPKAHRRSRREPVVAGVWLEAGDGDGEAMTSYDLRCGAWAETALPP